MLYIAQKSADDPRFGATKLNKILYYADFIAFARLGAPITGVQYMKLAHGPAPRALVPVKREMIEAQDAEEIEMMYHGRQQVRLVAKRPPDLEIFTADQIAIVDEVIQSLRLQTATEVSEMSHTLAWKIAGHKGAIPYPSVFLSDQGANDADREWASTVLAQAS